MRQLGQVIVEAVAIERLDCGRGPLMERAATLARTEL
jgi:hypothetical protein